MSANPYNLLNLHKDGMPLLVERCGYRSARPQTEYIRVNAALLAPFFAELVRQIGYSPLNHELYVFRLPTGNGEIELSVLVSDGWATFGSPEIVRQPW